MLAAIKIIIFLYGIWLLLSSVIPSFEKNPLLKLDDYRGVLGSDHQTLQYQLLNTSKYNLNSEAVVANGLVNTDIYLVIAHPDDEVMFFTPVVTELVKELYFNKLHIFCFSNGNSEGLGQTRHNELLRSAEVVGIDKENVQILDKPQFRDSIDQIWETEDIVKELENSIQPRKLDFFNLMRTGKAAHKISIITFDGLGVSKHPNHKSLYHGCVEFVEKKRQETQTIDLFVLKTQGMISKYSATLLSIFGILNKRLDSLVGWLETKDLKAISGLYSTLRQYSSIPDDKRVSIFGDITTLITALHSMNVAHDSQMVWFRWLWMFFSSYLSYNELTRI
ncbi:BA75_01508T0 [Komagataella pastoris]|uniref:N-acetylglucosaminylphosphatidylinositol deacetylase n=1 Tax=Komagataella pastoris TaxID=4922 RepID=A0A1B2J849_PICPA|nr:BA75_01508T0 [Komagataella pastoris]